MKITFLGTGTSQGVPVVACSCEVCKSTDTKDKRLRSSVLINYKDINIVIDAGPDFRQQMLTHKVKNLEAILLSHGHKDHIGGLDDVRAFNWVNKQPMKIYCEDRVFTDLKREFAYAFSENPYPGVPSFDINIINETPFYLSGIKITPIRGLHYKLPVLGFRIEDFAYLTDFNYISDEEIEKLKDTKVLVVNGLRKEKHISHFTIYEAIELISKVNPTKGYITHISHQLGLASSIILPENIFLAYDNLSISIDD